MMKYDSFNKKAKVFRYQKIFLYEKVKQGIGSPSISSELSGQPVHPRAITNRVIYLLNVCFFEA